MNLTNGKRLLPAGTATLVFLALMISFSHLTISPPIKDDSGTTVGAGRLRLAHQVEQKNLDAVMAMMDAVIDKESLNRKRVDMIKGNISFIKYHLDNLVNTADTPTDKQIADRIEISLELLAKTTQVLFTPILEEIVTESEEIESRIVREDDISAGHLFQ